MLKIGVVLSGCGYLDGAEIREAVLTLLAIDKAGAEAVCLAPDADQMHVINHLTGKETGEKRNVLAEAARIARGEIQDLKKVKSAGLDAVIFPGGYGAAKNLCDFAVKGPDCSVRPDVAAFAREAHKAGKPIGVICIAPALAGKIFENEGLTLTIGSDKETAEAIKKMGHQHKDCKVNEIAVDAKNKIVSTPAYMCHARLGEIAEGIEKLVREVVRMAGK